MPTDKNAGNLPAAPTKHQLPVLEDLYADKELAVQQNALNKILNAPPKAEWIKLNPFADNTPYIPIERVEFLLTSIYIKWRVEIKEVKLIANSVSVTVRLFVLDPLTGEWDWQDGVGACQLQTAKGAGAIEFDKIKGAAVQMGAPAAESYAIKDAAEKFGKIFGKDLGRKDEINYSGMQEKKFKDKATHLDETMITIIQGKQSPQELTELYDNSPEYHHIKEFMQAITARTNELKKEATNGTK